MRFLTRPELRPWFEGKRVAVVGSGPGILQNGFGFIDGHEVVVRVNNYKLKKQTGSRTDVFYSFFGTSIKKTAEELINDGVRLCMCKCPNAHAIDSDWHSRQRKMIGVDYRPHYERRKDWWFCDTYIPSVEDFMVGFNLLGRHIPTTGFSAVLDILSFAPASLYLTGFDFFKSRVHNLDERWHEGRRDDPIRHVPERELQWLAQNAGKHPMSFDPVLDRLISQAAKRR